MTKWVFDKNVANNFYDIANANIPNYEKVIEKCLNIANKIVGKDDFIVDVGCATGHTLKIFQDDGFTNLMGVDNSEAMLDKCEEYLDDASFAHSDTYPKLLGAFMQNPQLVMANWTLHFITNKKARKKYIKDIYNALESDGVFILSEKIAHSDMTLDLYHDFKRRNKLTEKEISEKHKSLEDVLIPYPLSFYFDTLKDIGFKDIEIIDADYCFVTILARK